MKTAAPPPDAALIPHRKTFLPKRLFRYSAIELLIALVLLLVTAPLVEDLPGGELVEPILLTLVMLSAVLAVGARRRSLLIALLLVIPAIAGKWLNHLAPAVVSPVLHLICATLFFGFVIAHLLQFILRAPRVDTSVLCAGLAGYLLLGVLWTPLYLTIYRWNPSSFTLPSGSTMDGFTGFYFSFITLTTVGYGDIAPVSRVARMLAVIEAVVGLFYMAVLISRLVSVYSSTPPPKSQDN